MRYLLPRVLAHHQAVLNPRDRSSVVGIPPIRLVRGWWAGRCERLLCGFLISILQRILTRAPSYRTCPTPILSSTYENLAFSKLLASEPLHVSHNSPFPAEYVLTYISTFMYFPGRKDENVVSSLQGKHLPIRCCTSNQPVEEGLPSTWFQAPTCGNLGCTIQDRYGFSGS